MPPVFLEFDQRQKDFLNHLILAELYLFQYLSMTMTKQSVNVGSLE